VWERRLYRSLTDDDDEARACEAIPEEACREVPRNFLLNAANGSATKLAEELASPSLVLPWLLDVLAAPVALVGWLEPLRQGGSLAPQILVSAEIRSRAVRKWFWVAAGSVQGVLLAVMAVAALVLQGLWAGLAVLGLLALFSVASGVGSVAYQDVLGKTVPRGKRGQLLAIRATAGGVLTLLAGLAIRHLVGEEARVEVFAGLIAAAATLWLLGALVFAAIEELPGATAGGRNAIAEVADGMRLVARNGSYRRYLSARALLLPVELQIPFLALHARSLGLKADALGGLVVALGLSKLLSSPLWGRVADRVSSRLVMVSGAAASAAALAVALGLDLSIEGGLSVWIYGPVFVLAGLARAGVRLGRKTYLVDATREQDRALYVSVANTSMGVLAFAWGALGLLVDVAGIRVVLLVLLATSLAAAALASIVPEAEA
jgi:sugar phosphate permease